jgi:hypothetical protein
MDSQHLLVPIKVQALVIDDIVINRAGSVDNTEDGRRFAGAGRWSPQRHDYVVMLNALNPQGPRPFYGAQRNKPGSQLVLDPKVLPKADDRGVYLHWVLPAGLRHAYTPGSMDFPALPDHWLIVRFARAGSTLNTNAWFIDGGVVNPSSRTNLVFPDTDKFIAKNIGKEIPLTEFATANFSGERTKITAIGNDSTGSPTFTASIGENRNIFSWHDKLADLRKPGIDPQTILTYAVLGWYRDPQNEPLSLQAARVSERRDSENKVVGCLIDPPGWSLDAKADDELLKRRSVFHGMAAHINYWSESTHKGPMLGYPGAPSVGGTLAKSKPAFKVGVGNNAQDALVSLVSSEYSGEQLPSSLAKEHPQLWKALEAVIYRQSETLVKSWNVASRDTTVHQNWFTTQEAGKTWYIRPKTDKGPAFPADAEKTAAETAIQPTPEQLAKLNELNQLQAEADSACRDLAALQQELYAWWWKLVYKSRRGGAVTAELVECKNLVEYVAERRIEVNSVLDRLRPLPGELKSKLPNELELKYDAAPRFWLPADPVIVVKNCGSSTKHQFPRQHPCRLSEEIITTARVVVQFGSPSTFSTATGVAAIAAAAQHLPSRPAILNELLNEASLVEQAVSHLADKTLPVPDKRFADEGGWSQWTERLNRDLTWDGKSDQPLDQITFEPKASNILPYRVVDLWGKQPWAPLFLDWQITWLPSKEDSAANQPFGPAWNFSKADFEPSDKKWIPKPGFTVRGRSLLAPIDNRIFEEPVETLRKLLGAKRDADEKNATTFPPAVIQVLKRYEIVWSETLRQLPHGGLMGQALTGFHQALLGRDITLQHIMPDSVRPWATSLRSETLAELKALEDRVKTQLEVLKDFGVTGERLAPPSLLPGPFDFHLIRKGAMRIDELWLVDDFGQHADLLGPTPEGANSTGQVFHPRMRWHDDPTVFAMPPRVLQPARLNFRFTPAAGSSSETTNHEFNSICGWIFYNSLDKALVLCNRKGELMGHLVILKDPMRIEWQASAGGVGISDVSNSTLKAFAESLIEPAPSSSPRLLELLNLIENSLERIRPAGARRDTMLVGRPLALVCASVGLELFGPAWNNPHPQSYPQKPPAQRYGSGDLELNSLGVRVNLGYAHNVEDGLIGYFKEGAYKRIVVPQLSDKVRKSDYIGDPDEHAVRARFNTSERLTLLMDPWGSVQAACGLVPAKTITLANPELDKIVTHMEASFRVGPVLLPVDKLAVPTPTGNKGTWNFSGPLTNEDAAAVVAVDPRYFGDQPVVAAEGRLLLLNED